MELQRKNYGRELIIMSDRFAVVDGGGTSLRFYIVKNGRTISSKVMDQGNFQMIKGNLKNYFTDLFKGVDKKIPLAVALAGLSCEKEKEFTQNILRGIGFSGNLLIMSDAHAAYIGAFSQPDNILIISGTGTIVYSVDSGGKISRVGGWGYILGDQGSGFYIGRELLKILIDFVDHRIKKTDIIMKLENHFQKDSREIIREFISSNTSVKDISHLTYFLEIEINKGSDEASEIFRNAAKKLSEQAYLLSLRTGGSVFALRGGVCLNCAAFREYLLSDLIEKGMIEKDRFLTPAGGALVALAGEEIFEDIKRSKDENFIIDSNIIGSSCL